MGGGKEWGVSHRAYNAKLQVPEWEALCALLRVGISMGSKHAKGHAATGSKVGRVVRLESETSARSRVIDRTKIHEFIGMGSAQSRDTNIVGLAAQLGATDGT